MHLFFCLNPFICYQPIDNACFVRLLASNSTTRYPHDTTWSTLLCAEEERIPNMAIDSRLRQLRLGAVQCIEVMIPRASGAPGPDPRKMFSPPGPDPWAEQGHSSDPACSGPDYCVEYNSHPGIMKASRRCVIAEITRNQLITHTPYICIFGWQLLSSSINVLDKDS